MMGIPGEVLVYAVAFMGALALAILGALWFLHHRDTKPDPSSDPD
jgi:hypothetical protein